MRPFVANGEAWRVITVNPGDPRLFDRTGNERIGTTDPTTRTVCLSSVLRPPMLDKVLIHEIAHAMTVSHGLLPSLHEGVIGGDYISVDEWAAQLVENHGIEALEAAAHVLGRPVCVNGLCHAEKGIPTK